MDFYPKGYLSVGAGDLVEVTNVKFDMKNNAKRVPTLRNPKGGVTLGAEEATLSFDAVISEFGEEMDYYKALKKGTFKQFRIKIPGRTIAVDGVVDSYGVEYSVDDAIKQTINVLGNASDD